jgi:hypothetical protein
MQVGFGGRESSECSSSFLVLHYKDNSSVTLSLFDLCVSHRRWNAYLFFLVSLKRLSFVSLLQILKAKSRSVCPNIFGFGCLICLALI